MCTQINYNTVCALAWVSACNPQLVRSDLEFEVYIASVSGQPVEKLGYAFLFLLPRLLHTMAPANPATECLTSRYLVWLPPFPS